MSALRIGILVDSALKQQYLTSLIVQAGHTLAYCSRAEDLVTDDLPLDAWVIDMAESDASSGEIPAEKTRSDALLNQLLERAKIPVILSDSGEHPAGSDEHKAWLRRMGLRLGRLGGDISLQQAGRASRLWVLAASTGGPAAVKEFLTHLPAELGIAFVYVQHIDTQYGATLVKMMSSAGNYPTTLACHGAVLQRDAIALVTAERGVEILENGTLLVNERPWGGRYAPSIDQVAANVARVYRERSGLIIFTGMGDDGAASSRLIKQQGGQVWVQSPENCTSSSMPEAALATKCVSFSGTPKELALHLAAFNQSHS